MKFDIPIIALSYYTYLSQNRYRKYITTKGRVYKEAVENALVDGMVGKEILKENIKVTMDFYINNQRKNDIDNFVKPMLDFMGEIVFVDDRQVVDLHVRKFYDKENPRVIITVEEVNIVDV